MSAKESEICCVCLCKGTKLTKLSWKNSGTDISLFAKIQKTIPEVEWMLSYKMCEACISLLNVVYEFRETCLKSDLIRRQKTFEAVKKEGSNGNENFVEHTEEFIRVVTDTHLTKEEVIKSEEEQDCPDLVDDSDLSFDINRDDDVSYEEVKAKTKKKKNVRFPCEKCENVYASSKILVSHCEEDHKMSAKEIRPFACTRCPSRFANSSNLLQHIKYHDAVRSSICTYCGKGFITKTDLIIHEKHHLNKRDYKCDICNKCYNTHKDLRSHKLVVHTDSKLWKFECGICSKKFPIKSNYDCHMRRHTNDRKFECHLCDKKFTDKCVLQRHMRTHSNVRNYKCSQCAKEYKDKRVMLIHMAKVHGIGVGEIKLPSKERKYACHFCGKAYFAKNKLTRHLWVHTGEKPFSCTICQKKFNDKTYVKIHMKKSHNIEDNKDIKLE